MDEETEARERRTHDHRDLTQQRQMRFGEEHWSGSLPCSGTLVMSTSLTEPFSTTGEQALSLRVIEDLTQNEACLVNYSVLDREWLLN